MFDLPLHPLVVHFPIVLGILIPLIALPLWWAIKKGLWPQRVWIVLVALTLAYGASSLVAVELGEHDEDKVEKVVSEEVIEEHEEAGEMIPWVAGALFVISAAGFALKRSHHARLVFAILSFAAIIPLAITGHTGGELVYKYGAAKAHVPAKYQNAMVEYDHD